MIISKENTRFKTWFTCPKQNSQFSLFSSFNSILAFLTMPFIFQTVEMASLYIQSAIHFDGILWISERSNQQRTNVTTRSQTRKSPSNIDQSIQAAPQIESSHQDLSIENSEPMEIDAETSEYEATRFLAMLQAEDENFTPESSQYSNHWSATPVQVQEILPTIHSDNWHH